MPESILYEEFRGLEKEKQAEILQQLIKTIGMKQIIGNWLISKEEYYNLVNDLNIVARGRKPGKKEKPERKPRAKKAERAAKPEKVVKPKKVTTPITNEEPETVQEPVKSARLFFNLDGDYQGRELSPILTGLSRMVEGEGNQFKAKIIIEKK